MFKFLFHFKENTARKKRITSNTFMIGLFMLFSCNSIRLNENYSLKKEIKNAIVYESSPNGSAEIKLDITPNGSFTLYMMIYPETGYDEEYSLINYSGKWIKIKNKIRLEFSKGENINDIFCIDRQNYEKGLIILNKNTVEISINSDTINIWGIRCERLH